jgi:hypothetical protein
MAVTRLSGPNLASPPNNERQLRARIGFLPSNNQIKANYTYIPLKSDRAR